MRENVRQSKLSKWHDVWELRTPFQVIRANCWRRQKSYFFNKVAYIAWLVTYAEILCEVFYHWNLSPYQNLNKNCNTKNILWKKNIFFCFWKKLAETFFYNLLIDCSTLFRLTCHLINVRDCWRWTTQQNTPKYCTPRFIRHVEVTVPHRLIWIIWSLQWIKSLPLRQSLITNRNSTAEQFIWTMVAVELLVTWYIRRFKQVRPFYNVLIVELVFSYCYISLFWPNLVQTCGADRQ